MSEKRELTKGYRTYEVEVMNVLDFVSPNAERLYRKLFQRVNWEAYKLHGEKKTFPSWKKMGDDTGFQPSVLSRAIKELEHFRLITVERPTEAEAINKGAHNVYTLKESADLPSGEVLTRLASIWGEIKAEASEKEKSRKAKYSKKGGGVLTQTESGTNTDIVGVLTQTETNKYEINQYEINQEWPDFEKIEQDMALSVKEDASLNKEDTPAPLSELDEICAPMYIGKEYPRLKDVLPVYETAHGTSMERFQNVVATFRDADVNYLKGILALEGIRLPDF